MKKKIILLSALFLLGVPHLVLAQENSTTTQPASRWYIGGSAGVAFGNSTFQSFGADKTRIGWGLGVLGGYRINSFLSTEASLDYTRLGLGSSSCCEYLWMDNAGNRHDKSADGYYSYKDIYSNVNLFQLGLHLNVDFLKILNPESRWSILLSPAVYGVGSMAKIKSENDGDLVYKGDGTAHFAVGGDLGVGYQVSDKVNVRLFGGINYMIDDKAIDAVPRVEHDANYVWNTGVKVIFSLGKKSRSKKVQSTPIVQSYQPVEQEKIVTETVAPVEAIVVKEPLVEEKIATAEQNVIYKVTIYYDTNSADVKKKFYYRIAVFLNKAKANSDAKIILDGWADETGTDNINDKISNFRADLLRKYFISQKIDADRITSKGNGVDSTPDYDHARRVDVLLVEPK